MAIIKCKMCGGDMELSPDKTFGICEYCGNTMTLPRLDDEQRASAFNRGNHFRRQGEFDKALAVYERIVAEDDTDAEAHWCCALCRFGIEYVEDPTTFEWLPTCHRASFDSFLEDVDYVAAVEHSDGVTRRQYQKDAVKIADVQKGILATSQNEEPFDVFLCYKESDEDGNRTRDSLMAQDIYYQLTEQGRRVFFARITLEDKGGAQYEPYIFAALHSAKVMVVVTTSAANVNSVWVKNEWSRFLSLMRKDKSKLLLPCFRDMDPYDLPEALSVLQSYDMAKIGFVQDLIRGINKVLDANKKPEPVRETVVVQSESGGNVSVLLKRGNIALEDGDFTKADTFFEQVLNADPECAEAYFGKFLARENVPNANAYVEKRLKETQVCEKESVTALEPDTEHIEAAVKTYTVDGYYPEKAIRKAYEFTLTSLSELAVRKKQYEQERSALRTDKLFSRVAKFEKGSNMPLSAMQSHLLSAIEKRIAAAEDEDKLSEERLRTAYAEHLQETDNKVKALYGAALKQRKDDYDAACLKQEAAKTIAECNAAAKMFDAFGKHRDCPARAVDCRKKASRITAQQRKKTRNISLSIIGMAILAAVAILLHTNVIVPAREYRMAEELLASGDTARAAMAFYSLSGYRDARERSFASWDDYAVHSSLSAGYFGTVGLKADGSVVIEGEYIDGQDGVKQWTDIVSIAAGDGYTVGLKADGTVVAVGSNEHGECDVEDWTDIIAIATGSSHTVGLKADGTVVTVGVNIGGQCNTDSWTDIVAISAGINHTVGLKADGTVVAVGKNDHGQCNTNNWKDINAIASGVGYTVGLKSDGRVVAIGNNDSGQCDVKRWKEIVSISAGCYHSVGLKADGTAVAAGLNYYGECNVENWTNIVAVSAQNYHTVGLTANGTVVATGNNDYGQCNVESWSDIKVPAKRGT